MRRFPHVISTSDPRGDCHSSRRRGESQRTDTPWPPQPQSTEKKTIVEPPKRRRECREEVTRDGEASLTGSESHDERPGFIRGQRERQAGWPSSHTLWVVWGQASSKVAWPGPPQRQATRHPQTLAIKKARK